MKIHGCTEGKQETYEDSDSDRDGKLRSRLGLRLFISIGVDGKRSGFYFQSLTPGWNHMGSEHRGLRIFMVTDVYVPSPPSALIAGRQASDDPFVRAVNFHYLTGTLSTLQGERP